MISLLFGDKSSGFGDISDLYLQNGDLSPSLKDINQRFIFVISPIFLFSSKDISFTNFFSIFHQQLFEILQEDISSFHTKMSEIDLFSLPKLLD